MTWAKIIEGKLVCYPYTEAMLLADNPGASFPDDLTECDLSDFGVAEVMETPMPAATDRQTVEEITPAKGKGGWAQAWAVRDRTPDEVMAAQKAALRAAVDAHADSLRAAIDLANDAAALDAIGIPETTTSTET